MRLAWLMLILALGGCTYTDRSAVVLSGSATEFPQIIYWNKQMPIFDNMGEWWLREAKTRFTNPVIFICHGGYKYQRFGNTYVLTWYVYPDTPARSLQPVQEVADTLANIYPNSDIVMVVLFLSIRHRLLVSALRL